MTPLQQIIAQETQIKGIIPFDRFMELALYCPNLGYYEQKDMSPGTGGDFLTSVSVGPLFGTLLANSFASWVEALPQSPRQILECAAHDGRLAADILTWFGDKRTDLFETLEYWILEPSERLKKRQQETLACFGAKVKWFQSWEEVPKTGINGAIFANELLDAMPVRRFGWESSKYQWFEWGVALENDQFVWKRMTESAPPNFTEKLPPSLLEVLPDGFITETGSPAIQWWREAAKHLAHGKLMTLDYGLTQPEFFMPHRKEGTLRAYKKHQLVKEVLADAGEQDITAQVNFDAIIQAGKMESLQTESFVTQEKFLTSALQTYLKDPVQREKWTNFESRQFKTLTHPSIMGRSFRVLVQAKG